MTRLLWLVAVVTGKRVEEKNKKGTHVGWSSCLCCLMVVVGCCCLVYVASRCCCLLRVSVVVVVDSEVVWLVDSDDVDDVVDVVVKVSVEWSEQGEKKINNTSHTSCSCSRC